MYKVIDSTSLSEGDTSDRIIFWDVTVNEMRYSVTLIIAIFVAHGFGNAGK